MLPGSSASTPYSHDAGDFHPGTDPALQSSLLSFHPSVLPQHPPGPPSWSYHHSPFAPYNHAAWAQPSPTPHVPAPSESWPIHSPAATLPPTPVTSGAPAATLPPAPVTSGAPAANSTSQPRTGGKRRAPDNSSRAAPKQRRINDSYANLAVSTSTIVGVGPSADHIPEHVPTSFASVKSSTDEDGAGARDVWYFFRPLETNAEPAERPAAESEEPLLAKPKTPFVGCKLCKSWKVYKNVTSGGMTKTLRTHLRTKHETVWSEICRIKHLRPGPSQLGSTSAGTPTRTREPVTRAGLQRHLARWAAVDDQSINAVECRAFRDMLLYLSPVLEEEDIPHKDKFREVILQLKQEAMTDIVTQLHDSPGRISMTCDSWSSRELFSYFAITAHIVVEDTHVEAEIGKVALYGKNFLLAFHVLEGDHSGKSLARLFYRVISNAGLKYKLGSITMDNASNNDTLMSELKELLRADNMPFDQDGNRIRCFPHCINIATQTVLDELKTNPFDPVIETAKDPSELPHLTRYATALEADPVGKMRDLVTTCRSSGSRRRELQAVIADGNQSGRWSREEGREIREVQLLRDCKTRWSSTFLLIDRALMLYPAVKVFIQSLDSRSRSDIAGHLLTPDEKSVLSHVYEILDVPRRAQQVISHENTPTVSIALPAYALLLDAWKELRCERPELSHYINLGIMKIEEYVFKSRRSRIYAIAMVLNPTMKLQWIRENWTPSEAANAQEWVIEAMLEYRIHARKQMRTRSVQRSASLPLPSAAHKARESQKRGLSGLRALASRRVQRSASTPTPASPPASEDPDHAPAASEPTASTSTAHNLGVADTALADSENVDLARDRLIVEQEIERYLAEDTMEEIDEGADLYRYWASRKYTYPYLYRVALDILPAQASAVSCERMFSSGKETDTLRRNRLSPELMEALQILKYYYKQELLCFSSQLLAREEDYTIEGPVTEAAVDELLKTGQIHVLEDLLRNSRESEASTIDHTSSVFT